MHKNYYSGKKQKNTGGLLLANSLMFQLRKPPIEILGKVLKNLQQTFQCMSTKILSYTRT